MENPNKNTDEQTAAEVSVVSPDTGLEPTASQGTGKHKKHAKKRSKSSNTNTADGAKSADGGAQSSLAKPKKEKRDFKSKTDAAALTPRLESQPQPSPAPPAEAFAEIAVPAAPSADPTASAATSQLQPAPAVAAAEALSHVAGDDLAQPPAQVGDRPQAETLPPGHDIGANVPANEHRKPKPALLSTIGSVILVFLMVATIVGMMIARRKQIQISKTSTAGPAAATTANTSDEGAISETASQQTDTSRVVASDEDATAPDVSHVTSVRPGRVGAWNSH